MNNLSEDLPDESLGSILKRMEARLTRIEQHLSFAPIETTTDELSGAQALKSRPNSSEELELEIGEYWFTKVGIVVLAVGIIFLLTFPYENLPSFAPSLFGYLLVGGIIALSHYWRESFAYASRYLFGGALALLYFCTLRLTFFSDQPVITDIRLEIFLLSLVVALNLYIAVRRNSIYLIALNLVLGCATAIVSNQPFMLFSITALMAMLTVYFQVKFQWRNLIIAGILLVYFTHLIWFINNPFINKEMHLVLIPQNNILFLLLYTAIFASANLLRSKEIAEDDQIVFNTVLNCLGGYGLYLIIASVAVTTHYPIYHILASGLFLALAIIFWLKEKSKSSTFIYSFIGFLALSVAIIARFEGADIFVWLCWQSLLVVAAALWFRSKIIVVANFIIFSIVFLSYLFSIKEASLVSLSFGVVALLSARIMNWQKHRLEIKTEFMRNAYLAVTFIVFPYSLYFTVAKNYVSLSWVGVAIFYYLMSIILKNKKYRFMALYTLVLTILYIFIIGIASFEPIYRIVSFLVLGVVLLAAALIYHKLRAQNEHKNDHSEATV